MAPQRRHRYSCTPRDRAWRVALAGSHRGGCRPDVLARGREQQGVPAPVAYTQEPAPVLNHNEGSALTHRHILALAHVAAQHVAHAMQAQVQAVHEDWVGDTPAGREGLGWVGWVVQP